MSEITIIKGAEFKIAVEEKVTEANVFLKEYRRAAVMLDDIAGASAKAVSVKKATGKEEWSWKQQDFENNIIAFCGERGEGKSSAMTTFVNLVHTKENKDHEIFSDCTHLKAAYFSEPLLIDPSQFDDVHNVLDIVLARIFQNFYERYSRDNQCVDEKTRENLLSRFQTVYRYVSLINNQKQMLDDEFDYEGNITKLIKLGESTRLKKELAKLIEDYLNFINGPKEQQMLVLAIDDLDLCSGNAYKMAEQIRKYLIIPQVAIVISVRIEQLELCIREKNQKDFQELYKNRDEQLLGQLNWEIRIMAERYVAKLIPNQRRIYLPKVQRFDEIHIVYKNDYEGEALWDSAVSKTFAVAMLDLIYDKTGMYFLPEKDGTSYLLPDNLRDMISWVAMLVNLKNPEGKDEVCLENIEEFERYFRRQNIGDGLKLYDGLTLQDMAYMDAFHLHITAKRILGQIFQEATGQNGMAYEMSVPDRPDSYFQVIRWFELLAKNLVDKRKEAYVYRLRVLYTIKMNELLRKQKLDEITQFMNGYIWGPYFSNLLPARQGSNMDRSRFVIETFQSFNKILEKINRSAPGLEAPEFGKPFRVRHIAHDRNRKDYIRAWILLGLLSNVFVMNNTQTVYCFDTAVIFDNNITYYYSHISLENYMVGLCNLEDLYRKVNMQMLNIKDTDDEDFEEVIREITESNPEKIACAGKIAANLDLTLGLKDYWYEHRDYKGSTEGETDRSRKLTEQFFNNIDAYMKQCGVEYSKEKWGLFSFGENGPVIDICTLYAELFDISVQNIQLRKDAEENLKIENAVAAFRKKLTEIPVSSVSEEADASTYLRNWSAENAKRNLDVLASKVQWYLGNNHKSPDGLDVEELCKLYGSVERIYLQNKNDKITQEMHEKYKRLVEVQAEIKRYPNGH